MVELSDGSPKALYGPRRRPSPLLANMVSARSSFSGSHLNHLLPCTSSEGQLCDIFRHLPLWNEFFWQVGLELKELSPGELSLVDVRDSELSWTNTYFPHNTVERVHEAATLLHHLLRLHRCVVSVFLNEYIFVSHVQLICDALRNSPSLRNVRFFLLQIKTQTSHFFAATLPHLSQLRELDLNQVNLDQNLLMSVSHFLVSTTSLKTLFMGHLHRHCEDVVVFFRGLKRNATITQLSLGACLLRPISYRCGLNFADYLRENKSLDILSMLSCDLHAFEEVCLIVGALVNNHTLSKLNFSKFWLDDENIQSISQLLCRNRTLKSFNLIECFLYEHVQPHNTRAYAHHIENFGSVSSRIYPWLVALTENKTLVELSLDLSWFKRNECECLFKVIAWNESLTKVHGHLVPKKDTAKIIEALRNAGRQDRFFFDIHDACQYSGSALTCERIERVLVDLADLESFESLCRTLGVLPSCKHVTWLRLELHVQQFTDTTSSLIAAYLTSTTALGELELCFVGLRPWDGLVRPERALVQALSVNKSLYRLFIQGVFFDETETQILADILSSSRLLISVTFYPTDRLPAIWLVLMLSVNFSMNYTLLGLLVTRCVHLGSVWFAITDVVHRNNFLVTRASHFVMGTEHKYCAAAFEMVHFTPGLVAKLQGLASIDKNEAELRIKRSLTSMCELHVFMRIVGVVKHSVTCHRRADGQVQLADLDRDSWLHIRQYITMHDMMDEE